jgi:hypothetical protein
LFPNNLLKQDGRANYDMLSEYEKQGGTAEGFSGYFFLAGDGIA